MNANHSTDLPSKQKKGLQNLNYAFLDDLSWDAFNKGTRLISSVEKYKARFGYYLQMVAADKIYCNRENRRILKELGIELRAKALGRPRAVDEKHVSPGERNQ